MSPESEIIDFGRKKFELAKKEALSSIQDLINLITSYIAKIFEKQAKTQSTNILTKQTEHKMIDRGTAIIYSTEINDKFNQVIDMADQCLNLDGSSDFIDQNNNPLSILAWAKDNFDFTLTSGDTTTLEKFKEHIQSIVERIKIAQEIIQNTQYKRTE